MITAAWMFLNDFEEVSDSNDDEMIIFLMIVDIVKLLNYE